MKAIDLFAGAGGFSTGAMMAGLDVVWAANHWPAAVEIHAANHPGATHVTQDLHQADWSQVPAHDILLAAPCCQGHSRARGKAANNPQHDASRSTAWAVVSALEYHRPQVGVVENVPEFVQWQLYPAWLAAVQALGYQVAPHIVDAADHGVPQHRKRLILVLTRSARPLMLQLPRREHVPVSKIIDFNAGNWSPIGKPSRSWATLHRIWNGRRAHGKRFVAPYYGSGSGATGRSLDRPIGTITTRDRWAVIDGARMRMITKEEARDAMSFPVDYVLPKQHRLAMHMLGNAVPPVVACDVLEAIQAAA
ncbi:DNA methyltransferase [Burkholderia ubonensis]|uniref:DNA (cytosine-5-)-methyltransferase n=1 Tax=Burkholderia ubonensis TaxID=101571 RepID=A0AAW3MN22_9BURK|nr:DNA cytosine methyltransferase [Burkholderia ubonensis]KVP87663.1 DNA methyltransferase [Burkholderia ubonensis]KWD09778.1 DNA methyltransferase [Burkholderia ubonensis]KWD13374.1 DNA methyltransferase [Burkholderia ubonensis]KWE98269.1 DNA methyltransferase [Burkholderia ubonensis]KWF07508.1 DNA methyltransferase [Burkholderia ubonensis]